MLKLCLINIVRGLFRIIELVCSFFFIELLFVYSCKPNGRLCEVQVSGCGQRRSLSSTGHICPLSSYSLPEALLHRISRIRMSSSFYRVLPKLALVPARCKILIKQVKGSNVIFRRHSLINGYSYPLFKPWLAYIFERFIF